MNNRFCTSLQTKLLDGLLALGLFAVFTSSILFLYRFDDTTPVIIRFLVRILIPLTFGAIVAITGLFFKEYIEISGECIRYHAGWFIFETTWNAVEIRKFILREGIMMNSPEKGFMKVFFSKTFVALTRFSNHWRDSELGKQIKQYAPHLFQ